VAKKIRFESFVYRFLAEAEVVSRSLAGARQDEWKRFIGQLEFHYVHGSAVVSWRSGERDACAFPLRDPSLYRRGDNEKYVARQREEGLISPTDRIQSGNAAYFRAALMRVCERAGFDATNRTTPEPDANAPRRDAEEAFHDEWAEAEAANPVDVRAVNEACTSPEMRYIRSQLGDLKGKRLLDVGCGLGEASVYFALEGAEVTSLDISRRMLDATARLAERNGVTLRVRKASAEDIGLPEGESFDVIYAGNLLHHVDIAATIRLLKPYLATGGVFVSWDPIAYNPVINVYRAMATRVRTPDEHPLRWSDIRRFRREFSTVTTRYFWLSTLIIFVLMAVVQRRDPNKERFWKAVVNEGDRWKPLFLPLSKLDSVLLAVFPPLRLLCWNVVVLARGPT
jgi:SAM-dependent methyltransferase